MIFYAAKGKFILLLLIIFTALIIYFLTNYSVWIIAVTLIFLVLVFLAIYVSKPSKLKFP